MERSFVFDLFGTLVAPTVRRDPYRRLIVAASELAGSAPRERALSLMREPLDLRQAWARLAPGHAAPAGLLDRLEDDLAEELASVMAYPDALLALDLLSRRGVAFTVCSNLAAPYAQALRLLPELSAPAALSFETGLLKPEPAMFLNACSRLGSAPERCVMVGDRIADDCEGGSGAGLFSVWVNRSGKASTLWGASAPDAFKATLLAMESPASKPAPGF